MTDLTPFSYDGHDFRVYLDAEGAPVFVAADVARALDLTNIRSSLSLLDDDERGVHSVDTPSGTQQMNVVTEAGLYSLILRSRRPEAKAFKRWVTHEVLPTIRRTGSYSVASEVEQLATAPRSRLLSIAAEHAERAEQAEAALALAAPKAEAFETFLSAAGDYDVRAAAKLLSRDHGILTGERRLRTWLIEHGWVYRDSSRKPRPYQRLVDAGHLAERATFHYHPSTGEKIVDAPQLRITPKGLERLRVALGGGTSTLPAVTG